MTPFPQDPMVTIEGPGEREPAQGASVVQGRGLSEGAGASGWRRVHRWGCCYGASSKRSYCRPCKSRHQRWEGVCHLANCGCVNTRRGVRQRTPSTRADSPRTKEVTGTAAPGNGSLSFLEAGTKAQSPGSPLRVFSWPQSASPQPPSAGSCVIAVPLRHVPCCSVWGHAPVVTVARLRTEQVEVWLLMAVSEATSSESVS